MQVTIYVPDELHRRIKRSGLPVSKVCQDALRVALDDPVPEELAMDTLEGITEALKDVGFRHRRELERLALVIKERWRE